MGEIEFGVSSSKGAIVLHFNSGLTVDYNLNPETILYSLFKPKIYTDPNHVLTEVHVNAPRRNTAKSYSC